jgi:tyrosine-protein phosphatase SIW14
MLPVSPGIFRGPQPVSLAEFQALHARGIRTVLDLENEPGEARVEEEFCYDSDIAFVSMPMAAWWPPPRDELVRDAVSMLANPAYHPILVHCRFGRDRTGLIVGMYRRRAEGWTRHQARAEMRQLGFRPLPGLMAYWWTH